MIKYVLIIALCVQTLFILKINRYSNFMEKNQIQLNAEIDSLKNEVFIHSTNETRYEIARNNLILEYKECGEKFDEMLSQTE